MEIVKIFAPFFVGCLLLGISCILSTISIKTKTIGTSVYFKYLPATETLGKILKVISIVLIIITAIFGVYYMIIQDYRELISLSIFIFFGIYFVGVNFGGHISCWIINTFTKYDADTSLVDDMTSC